MTQEDGLCHMPGKRPDGDGSEMEGCESVGMIIGNNAAALENLKACPD